MKKLFLLIFGLFGFISFCSAWSYTMTWSYSVDSLTATTRNIIYFDIPNKWLSDKYYLSCDITNFNLLSWNATFLLNVVLVYKSSWNIRSNITYESSATHNLEAWHFERVLNWNSTYISLPWFVFTLYSATDLTVSFDWSCTVSWTDILSYWWNCSNYTSQECQLEYNLIPVENVDSTYCEINDLCWSWNNSEITWDVNWSSLYINENQYQSAWIINITIPEDFDWDYSNDEEEFNLDVVGYNVDTEYIENIINKQTSLPNNTDFNNIITWLIPLFVPWLVIILFIYFVFRFIKKLF